MDGPSSRVSVVKSNFGAHVPGVESQVFDSISIEFSVSQGPGPPEIAVRSPTTPPTRTRVLGDFPFDAEGMIRLVSLYIQEAPKPAEKYHTGEDVRAALIRPLLAIQP